MTQSFYTRLLGWQILRNLEPYTLPPPPQRLANCSGNSMPLFLFNPPKILIYKIYYESIFRGRKVDWKYFCLFLHKIGLLSITRLLRHISCKQCCRSWKIVSFISNDSWEIMENMHMLQQIQKSYKYINTLHREEQWRWWGPYSTLQEWLSDKGIVQTLTQNRLKTEK